MNTINSNKKWIILLICGLWGSYEQWYRIMVPFSQWQLQPRPDLYDTLVLNSIGNGAIFVGSFLIAHLIASIGERRCAILSTIFTGCYQLLYGWIHNYYLFGFAQLLLLFNHMPTVVDALIVKEAQKKVEQNERIRLIMQVSIPTSIAFAAGPFMAVQLLYMFNPGLQIIQSLCGTIHLLTVLPIAIFLLPDDSNHGKAKHQNVSTGENFRALLKGENVLRTIVFIMIVSGPYNAYDQVIRLHLTGYMLTKPYDMALLALLLGTAALGANMIAMPLLQKRFYSPRIIQIALVLMIISYIYLIFFVSYYHIMAGMIIQIIGICLSLGQLTAQLMCSVPRSSVGQASALNRMAQLAASTMTPLITGYYIDHEEATILCCINIAICTFAIVLIEFYGGYMGRYSLLNTLPLSATRIE